jgi:hypothetical protein
MPIVIVITNITEVVCREAHLIAVIRSLERLAEHARIVSMERKKRKKTTNKHQSWLIRMCFIESRGSERACGRVKNRH